MKLVIAHNLSEESENESEKIKAFKKDCTFHTRYLVKSTNMWLIEREGEREEPIILFPVHVSKMINTHNRNLMRKF